MHTRSFPTSRSLKPMLLWLSLSPHPRLCLPFTEPMADAIGYMLSPHPRLGPNTEDMGTSMVSAWA